MKKLFTLSLMGLSSLVAVAQITPTSQMERLDRGLVVIPTSGGEFISWRLLGTDDELTTSFDVLRNGTRISSNVTAVTNVTDANGKASDRYSIVTKVNNVPVDTTDEVAPWTNVFYKLKLQRPEGGALTWRDYDSSTKKYGSWQSNVPYTYSPNDCSIGDVDGDGKLELFVKWDPSNSQDNSMSCGQTGNVYLDCYRFDLSAGGEGQDAELLWRVDLGVNIRAGAHYTQYMVYDFDGDGKAELICKTGPGSKDGTGQYVSQAATDSEILGVDDTKDWRSQEGRILGGQEWLTVFEGATGRAVHTIFYNPNRNQGYGGAADGSFNWGTPDGKSDSGSYGNRGERFLAAVAYLGGADQNPSAIFTRGYYGYAFVWAVDFYGGQLHQRWLNASTAKTSYKVTTYDADGKGTTKSYSTGKGTGSSLGNIGSGTMFGNGNHNLSVGDVDGDGCDEIVWGSATCNNDGTVLCATGFGHGDAIHLAKHIPSREGYQVFEVHEDKLATAWDLHDAATGEILLSGGPSGQDNGRGIAANMDANVAGSIFWSSSDGSARSALTGEEISTKHGTTNFRIYWDGDVYEELFDGGKIDKWNGSSTNRLYINSKNPYDYNNSSTCNSTKSTPNLQADILGDWREELILWNSADGATLNIFSSTTSTPVRVPTLLHDHIYRMGVAWQNVGYNQPPHLGYYLPERFVTNPYELFDKGDEQTVAVGEALDTLYLVYPHCTTVAVESTQTPNGQITGRPDWLKASFSYYQTAKGRIRALRIYGIPTEAGDYVVRVKASGNPVYTDPIYQTVTIHVSEESAIASAQRDAVSAPVEVYSLTGVRMPDVQFEALPTGIYIVRQGNKAHKVVIR